MAPSGTVPLPPGVPGPASNCENDTEFFIPVDNSIKLAIDADKATPNPDSIPLITVDDPSTTDNDETLNKITWHGTSTESGENVIGWEFGSNEPEENLLPIKVTTMKKRTVKVAVHPVASLFPGRANDPPDLVPTKEGLEEKLNDIFGLQINAWFDVTILPVEPIAFDTADGITSFPGFTFAPGTSPTPGNRVLNWTSWGVGEVELLTANRLAGYNINVFLFGGATPIESLKRDPENPMRYLPDETSIGRANPAPGANYCIVDGDRDRRTFDLEGSITGYEMTDEQRSVEGVVHTIAHEIGHLIVGGGHPDEGSGVAPLQGTDRRKRIMCSGPNWSIIESKLLVKSEWEKAEAWLVAEELAGRMEP